MRAILDPFGFWVGLPAWPRQTGDLPPVAVDDAYAVFRDSPPVSLAVMGNDFDPDGGLLTLISAQAVSGTAVAEQDGTVTYTPPAGSETSDTVTYEIEDDEGTRSIGSVALTITDPQLSIDVETDNTLAVNAETGLVDIEITAPPEYAGLYQVDTADFASGPINLVPPSFSGAAAIGALQTGMAGLWIYEAVDDPGGIAMGYRWERDGSPIGGATSQDYTTTPGDGGTELTLVETASGTNGTRERQSAASSIAEPAAGVSFLSGGVTPGAGSYGQPKTVTLDMSGHNGSDDVLVVIGCFGGAGGNTLSSVTLDGNPSASLVGVASASGDGVYCGYAVFSGTTFAASSDLVIASASFYDGGAAAYAIPSGATVATLASQAETSRAGSDVSGDVADGDNVVATQIVKNGVAPAWTGLTEDYADDARAGEHFSAASASNLSAAAPLTITTTGTTDLTTAISIKVT